MTSVRPCNANETPLRALGQVSNVTACRFITCFVTVFATVIALTKDLPDVVGDRQHGIQTFATMLGAPRLTALGASLLG